MGICALKGGLVGSLCRTVQTARSRRKAQPLQSRLPGEVLHGVAVFPLLTWDAALEYKMITTTKEDILWHSMLSILPQARPSRRTTR